MAEVDLMVEEQVEDKMTALDLAVEIIVIEMVGRKLFPLQVSPLQGGRMKLIEVVTNVKVQNKCSIDLLMLLFGYDK